MADWIEVPASFTDVLLPSDVQLLAEDSPPENGDDDEHHRVEHGNEERAAHLDAPRHDRERDPPADDTLKIGMCDTR